jgi:hypothetical protein
VSIETQPQIELSPMLLWSVGFIALAAIILAAYFSPHSAFVRRLCPAASNTQLGNPLDFTAKFSVALTEFDQQMLEQQLRAGTSESHLMRYSCVQVLKKVRLRGLTTESHGIGTSFLEATENFRSFTGKSHFSSSNLILSVSDESDLGLGFIDRDRYVNPVDPYMGYPYQSFQQSKYLVEFDGWVSAPNQKFLGAAAFDQAIFVDRVIAVKGFDFRRCFENDECLQSYSAALNKVISKRSASPPKHKINPVKQGLQPAF